MKKVILLFIIQLFLFAPRLQAQNFWEQLPFPDTLDISCVAFNQAGDIFVTTGAEYVTNGVFRSTDEGQTWEVLLTNGNFGVGPIAINDSGHIYLHTYGFNRFFASYDTGNTWIQKTYPLIAGVSRIYFQGVDTILVASGKDDGVILLRTPDRGTTWETIFETYHHESESISDIAIAPDGTIYISMMCFIFSGQGGVYKSTDNGNSWQFVGLLNTQILNLKINSFGDIFIGSLSGTYSIYHDNPQEIIPLPEANAGWLVLNSVGYIYTNYGNGTMLSTNNGSSFEWVSTGASNGPTGKLYIDSQNYLFGTNEYNAKKLFRSKEPTYVGIHSTDFLFSKQLLIYPNPVTYIATIQLSGKVIPDGHYEMYLYEVSSKKVLFREVTINDNQFQIPLNHLTCGTYAIQLNVDSRIYFGTFIKL